MLKSTLLERPQVTVCAEALSDVSHWAIAETDPELARNSLTWTSWAELLSKPRISIVVQPGEVLFVVLTTFMRARIVPVEPVASKVSFVLSDHAPEGLDLSTTAAAGVPVHGVAAKAEIGDSTRANSAERDFEVLHYRGFSLGI